jgi:hypothetical protein
MGQRLDPYLNYADPEDHCLSILAEPLVQSIINFLTEIKVEHFTRGGMFFFFSQSTMHSSDKLPSRQKWWSAVSPTGRRTEIADRCPSTLVGKAQDGVASQYTVFGD